MQQEALSCLGFACCPARPAAWATAFPPAPAQGLERHRQAPALTEPGEGEEECFQARVTPKLLRIDSEGTPKIWWKSEIKRLFGDRISG